MTRALIANCISPNRYRPIIVSDFSPGEWDPAAGDLTCAPDDTIFGAYGCLDAPAPWTVAVKGGDGTAVASNSGTRTDLSLFWEGLTPSGDWPGDGEYTLAMADGRRTRFAFTPYSPGADVIGEYGLAFPRYKATAGIRATLECLDIPVVYIVDGEFYMWDGVEMLPFAPGEFRLTTQDGLVYYLDRDLGVTKVVEPNGAYLTFNAGGITHSSGKSIAYEWNGNGRIKALKGPDGITVGYEYDAGDLTGMTDPAGSKVSFPLARVFLRASVRSYRAALASLSASWSSIWFRVSSTVPRTISPSGLLWQLPALLRRAQVLSLPDGPAALISLTPACPRATMTADEPLKAVHFRPPVPIPSHNQPTHITRDRRANHLIYRRDSRELLPLSQSPRPEQPQTRGQ